MLMLARGLFEPALGEPAISNMDRPLEPSGLRRKMLLLGLLVLLAGGLAAFAYTRFALTRSITVEHKDLTIRAVTRGSFQDYVSVSGDVVPSSTVYLDVPTGGQVAKILVEEGEAVTIGQPLLVLRNANLELDVMGREAALTQQLYQLTTIDQSLDDRRLQRARELAEIDYQLDTLTALRERKGKLLERGFVPRAEMADLDRSIARYQRLRGNVHEAHSSAQGAQPQQASRLRQSIDLITTNLSLARNSLDSLRIKAPESGILTSLDADLGEAKAPGERIGQIDSINDFKVRANVDEFYLARVRTGQPASAQIGGRSYRLAIAKVYPDVKNRQFAIELKFTGAAPPLRRGQAVQLKLELGQSGESMILDNGPFYDETGGQWAFVVSPNGKVAERRPVKLGRRNAEKIEILGGLEAGARVIVSTYGSYLDFDRIEIRGD